MFTLDFGTLFVNCRILLLDVKGFNMLRQEIPDINAVSIPSSLSVMLMIIAFVVVVLVVILTPIQEIEAGRFIVSATRTGSASAPPLVRVITVRLEQIPAVSASKPHLPVASHIEGYDSGSQIRSTRLS
jgi:hypothetical protein